MGRVPASTPLEATVVKQIIKKLRAHGGFWYKSHGGINQVRGLPDIIGCYEGLFFGFEVKRAGRVATPYQLFTLQQIKRSGGTASVIYSFEEARDLIEERLRHREVSATPQD